MRRILLCAAVFIFFGVLYTPLWAAQSSIKLDQTYISESLEIAVNHPAGWLGTEINVEFGYNFVLASSGEGVDQPAPDEIWLKIGEYQNFEGDGSHFARRSAATAYDGLFVPGRETVSGVDGIETQIDGRTILYIEFRDPGNDSASGMWVAMPFNQDRYLVAVVVGGSDEIYQAMRDTVLAVIASAHNPTTQELITGTQRETLSDFLPADQAHETSNNGLSVLVPTDTNTVNPDDVPYRLHDFGSRSEIWLSRRNENGGKTYFQVMRAHNAGLSTGHNLLYDDEFYSTPGEYHYMRLNKRPAVTFASTYDENLWAVGVRLDDGAILVVRAQTFDDTPISDADMQVATTLAAYAEVQEYDFAGLQPMTEEGVQQPPMIDSLTITLPTPEIAEIKITYHDTEGDARVVFYNVTQSFGGEFTSKSDNILSRSNDDPGKSGSSTISYNCATGADAASVINIFLMDELGNAGNSRYIRMTCTANKAAAVELSAEEAEIPLVEQLGAPASVASNTPPEILDVVSTGNALSPNLEMDIIYKDLEGDARTIQFTMVDSDGIFFQTATHNLETTYAEQSEGRATYPYGIFCTPEVLSFYAILETTLVDAQNNTSSPFYIRLDCTADLRQVSAVTADSIAKVELPAGAPVIRDISFERAYSGLSQTVDMTVKYGDAEGDAKAADFEVIEPDTITFRSTTQTLFDEAILQTRGAGTLQFSWLCSPTDAFSNTIQMILTDAAGNSSQPATFQITCDVPSGEDASGTLISMGGTTVQPALQPTSTGGTISEITLTPVPQGSEGTAAPQITATPAQLIQCPGVLVSRLIVGQRARVIPGGKTNRIRTSSNTSASEITRMPAGSEFDVLDGPVCANGYAWWKVNYSGTIGWTAESDSEDYWLEPLESVSAAAPLDKQTCFVHASVTVNLRSGPGTNYSRAGALEAGTQQNVVGKTNNASGFTWYKLANGYWAREDVIQLQGDCSAVPVTS